MAKKNETEKEKLIRRLEEYIEYAKKTKRFADVGFYMELIEYIENSISRDNIDG